MKIVEFKNESRIYETCENNKLNVWNYPAMRYSIVWWLIFPIYIIESLTQSALLLQIHDITIIHCLFTFKVKWDFYQNFTRWVLNVFSLHCCANNHHHFDRHCRHPWDPADSLAGTDAWSWSDLAFGRIWEVTFWFAPQRTFRGLALKKIFWSRSESWEECNVVKYTQLNEDFTLTL